MSIFIKEHLINNASLIREAQGLTLLRKSLDLYNIREVFVPKIYKVTQRELHLQKILIKDFDTNNMKKLGKGLAKLHKIKFKNYGFEIDNFIGLANQKNILTKEWGEFFFEYRLLYQVSLIENEKLKSDFLSVLEKNKKKLISYLNKHTKHPSIVHGDLWYGNVLYNDIDKNIYLMDPSVHFANREVDVAMTYMFGGFSKEFYDEYNKEYPLEKDFETRKEIYNLYHYLNHYNLFGITYLEDCRDRIKLIDDL